MGRDKGETVLSSPVLKVLRESRAQLFKADLLTFWFSLLVHIQSWPQKVNLLVPGPSGD